MLVTEVSSYRSPDNKRSIRIGQIYQNTQNNLAAKVTGISMSGEGSIVTIDVRYPNESFPRTEMYPVSEFFDMSDKDGKNLIKLTKEIEEMELEGLRSYHLLDPGRTISERQVYRHYKGALYQITRIALDSNNANDFNKAIITYRSVVSGLDVQWALTVAEFLKKVDGIPRFSLATDVNLKPPMLPILLPMEQYLTTTLPRHLDDNSIVNSLHSLWKIWTC